MKARRLMMAGLLSVTGAVPAAVAQFGAPAAPPVPAVPGAAGAIAGPPAPGGLATFLGISKPQLEACRQKKCQTPLGQMLAKATLPLTALSGGIIPPFCPAFPSAQELADKGPVGAAAAVKADEAGAKARKAAVRYLGTVDCHYWPEAEAQLIDSLRKDRNECVRFEAALALGNGCCCTKATMEALRIAASCSDADGNLKETSDRVRAAAVAALEHCVSCFKDLYPPPPPPIKEPIREGTPEGNKTEEEKRKEKEDADRKALGKAERPVGAAYYAKLADVPKALIVEECRKTVAKYNQTASAQSVLAGNSLVRVVNRATATENGPAYTTENGVTVMHAESLSPRPATLWDMLVRQEPATIAMPGTAVARSTTEPVLAMPILESSPTIVKTMPKLESAPTAKLPKSESQFGSVLAGPQPVKSLTPSEVAGPYGAMTVGKTKVTKDEVAPAKLPTDRLTLKPIDAVKPPVIQSPKMAPTVTATYALGVLTENHPGAAREAAADKLTMLDIQSCPDLGKALLGIAAGNDSETTRKSAIKALVRNQVDTPEVLTSLEKLTDDATPAIRVEAAIGMARLKVKSKN